MSRSTTDPPVLPGLNYVRPLGQGGYAEVFLYEQTQPRMRVAVKVLFPEALSPLALERFAAEANTMAELADHPNIVQVFRSDITEDGRPYLVMKYYPQHNLAVRARLERLSVPEVLQIGVRVACAVETAHRAGILHRDIKPANILTSQYGEPGLTDFGIATTELDDDGDAEGLSIPWSPPEIVFASGSAGPSSDVYSLGATLWHLLTGHSPFEFPEGDNTSIAVMRRIREAPPPRVGRDDVPASLERLLAQSMAKRPEDRPRTALQFARALQSVEIEQRWSPTPLVLLESTDSDEAEAPEATGADRQEGLDSTRRTGQTVVDEATDHGRGAPGGVPDPDEPRTRRRPVVVAPDAAGTGGAKTSSPPGTRARQGIPEEMAAPETVRRPALVAPHAESVPDEVITSSKDGRRWLVVVGVLIVIVALGAGLALSHMGSKQATTTTTIHPTTPPTIASANNPPTATNFSATRTPDGQSVQFTWSVPNQQPGDVVGWRLAGATTPPTRVTTNQAVVAATGSVCIEVDVQSEDGTQASPAKFCGG